MSDSRARRLAALMRELERTERLPAAQVAAHQHRQLVKLARHAAAHAPHFRARLARAGLAPDDLATPEGLRRLPPLRRRDVQQAGEGLYSDTVPAAHLPLNETRTSGSTGEPVTIRRTAISNLLWLGITLRDHRWQRRDFSGRLASIRALLFEPVRQRSWGPPASLLHRTGPSEAMPITTDIPDQAAWLQRFDPDYLIIYPNNLAGLLRHCEGQRIRFPRLRQIRTVGETLPPALRDETRRVLGVGISDVYSSQEIGNIALECPESGLYHVMETVLVEVVGEDGRPCAPGATGRILVTDLFNLATPLVRYDIGDVAETGASCPCGRGLPVLNRILGRERNLILMPDGRRHWPLVGYYKFREVAPVAQYQIIQHSRESVEVRLVTERPLSGAEESALSEVIQAALGAPFRLDFVYFDDALPRGPGGKFEEFVCRAE